MADESIEEVNEKNRRDKILEFMKQNPPPRADPFKTEQINETTQGLKIYCLIKKPFRKKKK